jgi:hypothetical protein
VGLWINKKKNIINAEQREIMAAVSVIAKHLQLKDIKKGRI